MFFFGRVSSKQSYRFAFNETIFYACGWHEANCINWKVSVGLQWLLVGFGYHSLH